MITRNTALGLAFAVAGAAWSGVALAQDSTPIPVPDAAAIRDAEKTVQRRFRNDFADSSSKADRRALARRLLVAGLEERDAPAVRYVLLRQARDLAAQNGGLAVAVDAIRMASRYYIIDSHRDKLAVLKIVAKSARTPSEKKALATAYLKLADESASDDEYDVAQEAARTAAGIAMGARSQKLFAEANTRVKELQKLGRAYRPVAEAKKVLVEDSDDPDANAVLGKFLCLSKNEWEKGLPLLAKGSDAPYKAMAERELGDIEDLKGQVAIGDGWWELAKVETGAAKEQVGERAAHWYRLTLSSLTGLTKVRVQKRLGMPSVTGTPPEPSVPVARREPPPPAGAEGTIDEADLPDDIRAALRVRVTLPTLPMRRTFVLGAVRDILQQAGLSLSPRMFAQGQQVDRAAIGQTVVAKIKNLPCKDALRQILTPAGLDFKMEGDVVALVKIKGFKPIAPKTIDPKTMIGTNRIYPGIGFDGFTAKTRPDDIKARYGQPDPEGNRSWLVYRKRRGVDFLFGMGGRLLVEIRFNPGFRGKIEGTNIGIGSRDNQVFAQFGQPDKVEQVADAKRALRSPGVYYAWPGGARYQMVDPALLLWFTRGRVTQIVTSPRR